MWEILVPTIKPNTGGEKFFKTRYHRYRMIWSERLAAA
jgi:hypothetical protein